MSEEEKRGGLAQGPGDDERFRRLLIIEMVEQAKVILLAWMKRWMGIVTIVLTVIGLCGGSALIAFTVEKCADRDLEHARQATYEADMAARMAREKAGEAMDAVKNVQAVAGNTRAQLEILQQEIEREGTRVKGLIGKDVDLLRAKLAELERLVGQLAETKGVAAETLAIYKEKVANVEKEAREKGARFEDNVKYLVNIYFNERTKTLTQNVFDKLAARGFRAAPPMDITQAQKSPPAMHTQAPLVYAKPFRDLRSLSENSLTYTETVAKEKVDEVRAVVSSVPGLENPKVYTWEFFAAGYGQPFSVQASVMQSDKRPVIEVYLVNVQ